MPNRDTASRRRHHHSVPGTPQPRVGRREVDKTLEQLADEQRLRDLEVKAAVHSEKIGEQGRVIAAIEHHLGTLQKSFGEHRSDVQARFSSLERKALLAAVVFFASSANAERAVHLIGLG